MLNNMSILITGGTGSFGKQMVRTLLARYKLRKLVIFSRDELKQFEMAQDFPESDHECIRYFLGDVRDIDRLNEAFYGIDYVIHAAALKQVPAAEYNPFEAVLTNVIGAQNVIRAAIRQKVNKVIALSTDKAASPINLYGATKLCSEKLFIAGNSMSGDAKTIFAVVRYGNVIGSRGSVVPFFIKTAAQGKISITDERMTRFSITLDEGVEFVLKSFELMIGGEVFVPKIPSYRILDVAKAIDPDAKYDIVGIRPGEKLEEALIPNDEARHTYEFDTYFVIEPNVYWWKNSDRLIASGGNKCDDTFSYISSNNTKWMTIDEIKACVDEYLKGPPSQ